MRDRKKMRTNQQLTASLFSEAFVRLRGVANAAWDAEAVAWTEVDGSYESIGTWLVVRKAAFKAQSDFEVEVDRYQVSAGLA